MQGSNIKKEPAFASSFVYLRLPLLRPIPLRGLLRLGIGRLRLGIGRGRLRLGIGRCRLACRRCCFLALRF